MFSSKLNVWKSRRLFLDFPGSVYQCQAKGIFPDGRLGDVIKFPDILFYLMCACVCTYTYM